MERSLWTIPIHDAIEAGFNKVIFIIRKDIEEAFREVIGERIEAICKQLNVEIDYAFQAIDDLPKGVKLPKDRTKPWGTGQAVLACKGLIKEPFAVINAMTIREKNPFLNCMIFWRSTHRRSRRFLWRQGLF